MKQIISIGLFLVVICTSVNAKTLCLKSGREIQCDHFWVEDGKYVCESFGGTISFDKEQIDLKKMNEIATVYAKKKQLIEDKKKRLKKEIETIKGIKTFRAKCIIGKWMVNNQGLKSELVIKFNLGIEVTKTYKDGSQGTQYMMDSKYDRFPYGTKFMEASNLFGDYFVITDKEGTLLCFDNQGIIEGCSGFNTDWAASKMTLNAVKSIENVNRKLKEEMEAIVNKHHSLLLQKEAEQKEMNEVEFSQWDNHVNDLIKRIDLYKKNSNSFNELRCELQKKLNITFLPF